MEYPDPCESDKYADMEPYPYPSRAVQVNISLK